MSMRRDTILAVGRSKDGGGPAASAAAGRPDGWAAGRLGGWVAGRLGGWAAQDPPVWTIRVAATTPIVQPGGS
jgi:hypothetical protein